MNIATPIRHITLPARDVEKASQFFQATFGWPLIERPQNIPLGAAWLELAPGQQLHLLQVEDFEPSAFDAEFGRHFAVSCPLAQFGALRERLSAQGAELMEPLRDTSFRRFFVRTPDGHVIEVMEAESFKDDIENG